VEGLNKSLGLLSEGVSGVRGRALSNDLVVLENAFGKHIYDDTYRRMLVGRCLVLGGNKHVTVRYERSTHTLTLIIWRGCQPPHTDVSTARSNAISSHCTVCSPGDSPQYVWRDENHVRPRNAQRETSAPNVTTSMIVISKDVHSLVQHWTYLAFMHVDSHVCDCRLISAEGVVVTQRKTVFLSVDGRIT